MGGLAIGMASVLAIAVAVLGFLAIRNPVLVKLGVRNIPRRPAQTVLIIIGLMLSTTIIAAALALGDTISSSIRQTALDGVGNTDISLTSPLFAAFGDDYLSAEDLSRIRGVVDADERIDGVMPQVREVLPLVNERTDRAESRADIVGLDPAAQQGFDLLESVGGGTVTLEALGEDDIYLSEEAAEQLGAVVGDTIDLISPTGKHGLNVRDVVKGEGLAGDRADFTSGSETFVSSVAIGRLADIQALLGREGQFDRIELSVEGGIRPDRQLSDDVAKDLRVEFTDATVARELLTHLGTPERIAVIEEYASSAEGLSGSQRDDLKSLVAELKSGEVSDELRSQLGDNAVAVRAVVALEQAGMSEAAFEAIGLLSRLETVRVESTKSTLLDIADLIGSFFTTIFAIFGSFSIMVGLLLIFLVFVMLAAARSTEMGIARAIGTKRRQLVMSFVFEGAAYAAGASLAGTIMGVLASLALVEALKGIIPDDVDFTIRYTIQFRSLVVAFSAGMLITLITVAVSAFRVSKLNITVAIRGLPEQFVPEDTPPLRRRLIALFQALLGPLYLAYGAVRAASAGRPWGMTALGAGGLLAPGPGWLIWIGWLAVAAYRVVSPYLRLGWPLVIVGLLLTFQGTGSDSASLFSIGISVLFIGIGLLIRVVLSRGTLREEVVTRISFTVMGALLLIYWALPFDALEGLTGELQGDIEMFFLSGTFMVGAAVWLVMHNAEIVLWPLNATLGRIGRLRPVVRAAIAYPMAARFRTGLTVAMFALIIFTLMVFAVLNEAFSNTILDNPDRAHGGYDVTVSVSRDLPIEDINAAIAEAPELDLADFDVIAQSVFLPSEARQVGPYLGEEIEELRYLPLNVWAVDDEFAATNRFELEHFDPAYGTTPEEIWPLLAADPSLAVVGASVLEGGGDFGGGGFQATFSVQGVKAGADEEIEAFTVQVRPPFGTGDPVERTVIAVADPAAGLTDPQAFEGSWIMTSEAVLPELASRPVPLTRFDMRLRDASAAADIAPVLERVFLEHGIEATVNEDELREQVDVNQTFNRLFQGFMGLGLLVGVAALGVISFRAVVERRQAIGVLRAIGFKPGMVRTQFLIESSLIALLGIALGLGLGSLISWNLINDIGKEFEGLSFSIPWLTVAVIVAAAYVFSFVTTFWPARQASRIYPAEALRYE